MSVFAMTILAAMPMLGAVDTALPPLDLVRGLRGAEIAHLENDHGREFEMLKQVYETYPSNMTVLNSLLTHHRSHQTRPGEVERLQTLLIALLDDPEASASSSILNLVVSDSYADETILAKVAAHIERRLHGASSSLTATEIELLDLLERTYSELDDTAGRISALEKLVVAEPELLRRWGLLSLYRKNERLEDARAMVAAWLEEEGRPSNLRVTYIDLLSRIGNFDQVEKQLDLLVEEKIAERNKAQNQIIKGAHQLGTGEYTPRFSMGVVQNAAWNFRDAGQDEAAEKYFRKLLSFDPENQEVRNIVSYLYGSDSELQKLQAAEAARWQEEEDPNSLFSRGTDLLTAGDTEAALELLERAAPGLPELEAAWYNLGMAAYRLERWQTVAEAFNKASKLNSTRSQSFFYRGLALEKLGKCPDAVGALEKAVELDSSRHLAHYYLALCYQQLGQPEKSKSHRRLYDASRG